MNKVIRKYPVDRLPADLRPGLPQHGWVRIETEPEPEGAAPRRLSTLIGSGKNIHGDPEQVLAHIRSLREDR
jgi:hypothetical protein